MEPAGASGAAMIFIFGWMRRFTALGVKFDECATCGQVCEHIVGRKTNWGHLFWIPLLFLGWEHGMICTTCGTWTGISWEQVRHAMKSGSLHLARSRPHAELAALTAPPEEAIVLRGPGFDRFLVNPRRGAWDIYLKAWPVLVAAFLLVGMAGSATKGSAYGGSTSGGSGYGSGTTTSGAAPSAPGHTCWVGVDGDITGCRMTTGMTVGTVTTETVTCYFWDADYAAATSLRCR